MDISFKIIEIKRRFPLSISRGTTANAHNFFCMLKDGDNEGIGEAAIGTGAPDDLAETGPKHIRLLFEETKGLSISEIIEEGFRRQIPKATLAALDTALWDLHAKKAGMPLYQLLGLPLPIVQTTNTIGLETPEVIKERVPLFLEMAQTKRLKVKLGSKDGIERDQENYLTAKLAAQPYGASLQVDANGGWSIADAKKMMSWLAEEGCKYVEQPLEKGEEGGLPELYEKRPLPIYLDESIQVASDVFPVAHCCDGVNMKLMKTGGITNGLLTLQVAKSLGLKTMIGCMTDSSVAIAAGAHLSGLCNDIDLDNHLNLDPDPAGGVNLENGIVMPSDKPGHGAFLK